MWEQYTTDAFSSAQRLDSLKTSHPVIVPIKHAEEVEQVFDAISYCKGSTVVNMVLAFLGTHHSSSHLSSLIHNSSSVLSHSSCTVGPAKFQEGLQSYMSKYAYGNTETVDLWNSWSEVSQKDVAQLMNTWTTVTGYPYLTVVSEAWTDSELVVTLRQARFLSDGSVDESVEGSAALWSIPLLFVTADSTSSEAVTMDQKEQTFSIPISSSSSSTTAPGWVKINAGQKALVRVSHSPEMITRLKASISSIAPVDRAALLLDAYALAKAGLAPLETAVDILRALKGETTSIVWSAISGVLSGLNLLMEQLTPTGSSDGYKAFVLFGKELVTSALALVSTNDDSDYYDDGDADDHCKDDD